MKKFKAMLIACLCAVTTFVTLGAVKSTTTARADHTEATMLRTRLTHPEILAALAAAGGAPEHLVSLHIYVTDATAYRAALAELGAAYRRHLGRHYVATALFEVAGLFDPAAKVELVGIAVVPDPDQEEQP